MDTALLLARLVLFVVFAVAGVAKLVDLEGSRRAMRDFGLPPRLTAQAAIALPIAELLIAVLLLPTATAWWGALGALMLLALFLAGIGYNLAHGRRPDCHCFGQLHSEPVGQSTLVRNTVLAGIALFVVAFGRDLFTFSNEDPGHSVVGWAGDLSAWEIFAMIVGGVLTAAVVLEGWLLLHLLRQNGRLLLRVDALEGKGSPVSSGATSPDLPQSGLLVGSRAPAFMLDGLYGETVTLEAIRAAGKPVLLLFMDPDCNPCNEMLPEVGQWQREHAEAMTVAVISRGSVEANRSKSTDYGIVNVLLQRDDEVAEDYQMPGTPTAILIDSDGTIGSPLAFGQDEIEALVERSMSSLAEADGSGEDIVGGDDAITPAESREPMPDVALPDLSGKTVRLSDLRGRPAVVLFWNPDCGFCQHMLPDLKAWEAEPPSNASQLMVVSMGTVEENTEMGLRSPVVLDQDFTTGRAFGVSGTPTAVMVDAEGRRASGEAMGASAVLELLRETSQTRVPATL